MSKYQEMDHAAAAGKLEAYQGLARMLDLSPLHKARAKAKAEGRWDSNMGDIIYLLEVLREEEPLADRVAAIEADLVIVPGFLTDDELDQYVEDK